MKVTTVTAKKRVSLLWVAGHPNTEENDRADELSKQVAAMHLIGPG